uniref:Capsid protein n=1 Tax=Myotis mistacinus feces associated cyclovirus 2 TaxID=3139994 RepID=A0AAU6S599_9CIRC
MYRRTLRRQRRRRYRRSRLTRFRSRLRRYNQRALTRRFLRSGSQFFTRLFYRLPVAPLNGVSVNYGPSIALFDFFDFAELAAHWARCRLWKMVVKVTPHVTESLLGNAVGNHCICPYYQDQTVGPNNKLNRSYDNIMSIPSAKHSRGTNPLTLTVIPAVSDALGSFTNSSLNNQINAGFKRRPLINCNRGQRYALDIYGFLYTHQGTLQASSTNILNVDLEVTLYCTFYNFNYELTRPTQ